MERSRNLKAKQFLREYRQKRPFLAFNYPSRLWLAGRKPGRGEARVSMMVTGAAILETVLEYRAALSVASLTCIRTSTTFELQIRDLWGAKTHAFVLLSKQEGFGGSSGVVGVEVSGKLEGQVLEADEGFQDLVFCVNCLPLATSLLYGVVPVGGR